MWNLFKSKSQKSIAQIPNKNYSAEVEDVFSDDPGSSSVSDEPPEFLKGRWEKFNSHFNDEELLVYGSPKRSDCLGRAAVYGKKASTAVKEKEFDLAWWIYHQIKALHFEHANKFNFAQEHIIGMDSGISKSFGNILRLEGKHQQALVHILYWQLGETRPNVKRNVKKIRAYYNRSKISSITFEDLIEWMDSWNGLADYAAIQNQVSDWIKS